MNPVTLALFAVALAGAAPPAVTLAEKTRVFAEEEIVSRLARSNIPGAVFAVADRAGATALWAGGVKDRESGKPMDARSTVVRVASTSKLFTALAAAELWVRGKLDLDADVNTYLGPGFVPEAFGKPVTMRQLLTHTAGFDERYLGIVARDVDTVEPLESFVRTELPERVFRPGVVTSYSNHGFALAGLVIERIAGEPFARAIDDMILKPLGMRSSSFALPAALKARLATGYELSRGEMRRVTLDRIRTAPASALITTAADMSRFLLLQLGLGMVGGRELAPERAVRELQRRQFGNAPEVAGFGLAFMEREVRGVRVLLHGGEARGVNTLFAIIPAQGLGFFLNYNRFGPDVAETILERFVATFVPGGVVRGELQGKRAADAGSAVLTPSSGIYQAVRFPHSSFTKIGAFMGGFAKEYRVNAPDADTLVLKPTLGWLYGEPESRWTRSGPVSFERLDRREAVVFRDDFLFFGNRPETGYLRVPWPLSVHGALAVLVVAVALACRAVLPWFWRGRDRRAGRGRIFPPLACLSALVFCAALGLYLLLVAPVEIAFGASLVLRLILFVGFLTGPLALVGWIWLLTSWRRRSHGDRLIAFAACAAGTLFFSPRFN